MPGRLAFVGAQLSQDLAGRAIERMEWCRQLGQRSRCAPQETRLGEHLGSRPTGCRHQSGHQATTLGHIDDLTRFGPGDDRRSVLLQCPDSD